MAKNLYLITYPWNSNIPFDYLEHIILNAIENIENASKDNYVVALPQQITLEQFDLQELKNIYNRLGAYIQDIEQCIDEEETE